MAQNKTILQLASASTLTGAEVVPVVQSGATVQATISNIVALAGGGSTPYNAGTISGTTVTFDRANGQQQYCSFTNNVTINASNGTNFQALDLYIVASGADRTLNINAAIHAPSDGGLVFPMTITSGQGCRVKLEKHGSTWMFVSIVKSFAP